MQVIIGCKLPTGIVLQGTAGQDVVLNGANTSLIAQGPSAIGLTHVEDYEADYLFEFYKDFGPVKSKSIFSYKTEKVADIAAMASELKEEATGFEGINPEAPAPNMQPENPVQLKKAQEDVMRAPRPPKAPAAPADKAASAKLAGKA